MKKTKIAIIVGVGVVIIIAILMVVGSLNGTRSRKMSLPQNAGMEMSGMSTSSGLSSGSMFSSSDEADSISMPAQEKAISNTTPAVDKKVIKNGNLTMRVKNVDEAVTKIKEVAKSNQGEIFSANLFQSAGGVKSGNITVKVPVANFEKTYDEMKKVAVLVERESTSGQDVTEQYVDLQSRLKNKQAEEQSFLKILEKIADTDNVIKVTRELSRVRGEIEVLQGQIRYLESQTDMSTITANISEDQQITITDKWRPLQLIKETVNSLVRDIQKYVNFIIILITRVIPIILLYSLILFIIYRVGKRIYRKYRNKNQPV